MLQKLPVALVQAKAGNTSKNLLNGIHRTIYSLHQTNEITKKAVQQIQQYNKFSTDIIQKWIPYL